MGCCRAERLRVPPDRLDGPENQWPAGPLDEIESGRMRVKRDDLAAVGHELGEMRGFSTRSRAEVDNLLSRPGGHEVSDEDRGLVLDSPETIPITGRRVGKERRINDDAVRRIGCGRPVRALALQTEDQFFPGHAERVDAEREWRP